MSRPTMKIQNPRIQFFVLSFLFLFALRSANALSGDRLKATPAPLNEVSAGTCQSRSQPNPIATTYPNNATGTLNGTVAVIPISLDLARSMIPTQYRILEHAYRSLLPSFPEGMYPVVLQAVHDHDVQAFGYEIPDFSRTGMEFPFLDLLGDNSTSFKWVPTLLLSTGNDIALKGAKDYGTNVFGASFDPPCDAYRSIPSYDADSSATYFSAKSTGNNTASVDTQFSCVQDSPFPLSFYKNVTNQVMFADAKTCDNMIRLFNTSVSTSPNRIETVKGTVKATMPPFTEEHEWSGVYGIRLDSAFIENNYLPCESFRGYSGSD